MSRVPGTRSPRLHVIFRSHGGENLKARPPYYSKLLALTSFVRAAGYVAGACSVTFLNDGPIPADRLELMRATGQVQDSRFGSNRASYRAAVRLACRIPAADDDLVWFAEDDYLYRPDALQALLAAADALPNGDYFSLYSPADLDAGRSLTGRLPWQPDAEQPSESDHGDDSVAVGHVRWFRAVSTTSTFAVRAGALRQDCNLLRVAPFTGGAWDHTTCVTLQGAQPFSTDEVLRDLAPFRDEPAGRWAHSIARGATRAAINLRSQRRPGRRRTLYGSDPLLAMHLETLEDGRVHEAEWVALAEQTCAWSREQTEPQTTG